MDCWEPSIATFVAHVILRAAFFADRRTYAIAGICDAAGRLHGYFAALRMTNLQSADQNDKASKIRKREFRREKN
jgi:hypothetical protein